MRTLTDFFGASLGVSCRVSCTLCFMPDASCLVASSGCFCASLVELVLLDVVAGRLLSASLSSCQSCAPICAIAELRAALLFG